MYFGNWFIFLPQYFKLVISLILPSFITKYRFTAIVIQNAKNGKLITLGVIRATGVCP